MSMSSDLGWGEKTLCLHPFKLLGALLAGSSVCSVYSQENLIQSMPRF